jgi:ligand-binding sensor domain-containing protein
VQTGVTTAPYNIQSWSGLAIQPSNGHLWLGAVNGGSTLVEYQIGAGGALTQLRTLDISAQGVNQNEISGLSFDAAGNLWVSSTQGEIYKVILP